VFESSAHDALACCDVSLAASGTILLEAVALDAPVVMTYKLDALTYLYGKYLLRVPQKIPYYSMPNIVANARVVPELVLEAATPERLAAEALGLLTDAGRREEMRRGFRVIRSRLGTPGVVSRVAQDILEFLAPSPQAVGAAERAGALFERARRAERHS
jgi:lipid-A-disaccharide synthase